MDLLSPVPDHKPVQFSVLFQSVTIWGNGEMRWWEQRTEQDEGEEDEVSLDGWKEWRNRSIFLNITCSVEKPLGEREPMWTNETEKQTDREVGGRGVRTYDTQGGGGACESLEEEERMGGNKTGEGEETEESRDAHLCLGSVRMQEVLLLLSPPNKLHFHLFSLPVSPDFPWILSCVTCWASSAV